MLGNLSHAIQFNREIDTDTAMTPTVIDRKPTQRGTSIQHDASSTREKSAQPVSSGRRALAPRTVFVGAGGDASTISGGIALVPRGATERWTVVVAPGVYRERVWIPEEIGPLTLAGAGADTTTLVYHCCPGGNGRARCSNATVDSLCRPQHPGAGMTRGVETLLVEAADFSLVNISVANDACEYDSHVAGQSEALQLLADRTVVANSRYNSGHYSFPLITPSSLKCVQPLHCFIVLYHLAFIK